MYLPAFPLVAAALHTSTARVSLSLAGYFAGLAAGQLFTARCSTGLGAKRALKSQTVLLSLSAAAPGGILGPQGTRGRRTHG
jgi:DHA1 family bicyclomycin/chloramphenicol resistance-like MFS transporter